jgi:16S rRNA (guanine966-N2)-methyltransferase
MRIIAGEFRGRRLKPPPGDQTRPTPDRLRESLFSILQPEIEGVTFLDAYAGTGSVGIEALSRGAASAVFIESNRAVAHILKHNLHALGIEDRAIVSTGKAAVVLRRQSAEVVFLDPPYALVDEYQRSLAAVASLPPRLLIVQHSHRFDPGDRHGDLVRQRVLRQGENALTFYRLLSSSRFMYNEPMSTGEEKRW